MVIRHTFGYRRTGLALLRAGWAAPEDAHTWSNAATASLEIPIPPGAGDPYIELRLKPFIAPPQLNGQRVRITLGAEPQPEETLNELACLGYQLDGALWQRGGTLQISVELPDRATPASLGIGDDPRTLAIALFGLDITRVPPTAPARAQRRPPLPLDTFDFSAGARDVVRFMTALEPRELMLAMESLGHNCEFGLLQRRFDAEPMGLLRFASIRPDRLIDGLAADFAGAADPALLEITQEGHPRLEFMVRNRNWGMLAHTFRYPDEDDAEKTLADQARKLRFQHRRFLDILKTGEKLFLFHDFHRMGTAQGRAILAALRRHGPNALLFVSEDDDLPSGSVELIERDLYCGHISRFAPVWAADHVDVTAWVSVCANAYRLWREQGFGAEP